MPRELRALSACSMARSPLPPLPWLPAETGAAMKLQDFRVGLRILAKDPVYSVVCIFGLGVGLGVCLLLLGYARYCWHYNSHVPDADRVYMVKQRSNLTLGT